MTPRSSYTLAPGAVRTDVPLPSQVLPTAWRAVRCQPSLNLLCHSPTFSTWVPEISPATPAHGTCPISLSLYLAVQIGVDDLLRLILALYTPQTHSLPRPAIRAPLVWPGEVEDGIVASWPHGLC